MALISTLSDGDIEAARFTDCDITGSGGSWDVVADVVDIATEVTISNHASEALAQGALQAVVVTIAGDAEAADGTFLNLSVLGVMRTALGGERIEIATDVANTMQFFTNHEDEATPGEFVADAAGSEAIVYLRSPDIGDGVGSVAIGSGAGDETYVVAQADRVEIRNDSTTAMVKTQSDSQVIILGDIHLNGTDRTFVGNATDPGKLEFVGEVAGSVGVPSANGCVLYLADSGAGKTQLRALFASGASQLIATQP